MSCCLLNMVFTFDKIDLPVSRIRSITAQVSWQDNFALGYWRQIHQIDSSSILMSITFIFLTFMFENNISKFVLQFHRLSRKGVSCMFVKSHATQDLCFLPFFNTWKSPRAVTRPVFAAGLCVGIRSTKITRCAHLKLHR